MKENKMKIVQIENRDKEMKKMYTQFTEFRLFGFNSEIEYYNFLNILSSQIENRRKELGFTISSKKSEYNIKNMKRKMFIDMFEMEVYEEIKRCVEDKCYNEAWNNFKSSQKYNERFVSNIEEYQRIFRKLFNKINKKTWKAEDVIKYIKSNEERISKRKLKNG